MIHNETFLDKVIIDFTFLYVRIHLVLLLLFFGAGNMLCTVLYTRVETLLLQKKNRWKDNAHALLQQHTLCPTTYQKHSCFLCWYKYYFFSGMMMMMMIFKMMLLMLLLMLIHIQQYQNKLILLLTLQILMLSIFHHSDDIHVVI
jgi:hypothetical protein